MPLQIFCRRKGNIPNMVPCREQALQYWDASQCFSGDPSPKNLPNYTHPERIRKTFPMCWFRGETITFFSLPTTVMIDKELLWFSSSASKTRQMLPQFLFWKSFINVFRHFSIFLTIYLAFNLSLQWKNKNFLKWSLKFLDPVLLWNVPTPDYSTIFSFMKSASKAQNFNVYYWENFINKLKKRCK